jgi:hypothetical protein
MPGDFTFDVLTTSRDTCNELIYNEHFDSGIEGCNDNFVDITWLATGDFDGSGALGTTKQSNINRHFPYKWLHVSCIEEGDIFDIEVRYVNVDKDNGNVEDACLGI